MEVRVNALVVRRDQDAGTVHRALTTLERIRHEVTPRAYLDSTDTADMVRALLTVARLATCAAWYILTRHHTTDYTAALVGLIRKTMREIDAHELALDHAEAHLWAPRPPDAE